MAEIGDVLGEWHKAKPGEKVLIVAISVAAVGIAIYIHSQAANSSATSASATPASTTLATGGTPSNGGTVGVTPSGPTTPPTTAPTTPAKKPTTPAKGKPKAKPPSKPAPPMLHANPIVRGTVATKTAGASHQAQGARPPAPTHIVSSPTHVTTVHGNPGSGPRVKPGPASAPPSYHPPAAPKPAPPHVAGRTGGGYAAHAP